MDTSSMAGGNPDTISRALIYLGVFALAAVPEAPMVPTPRGG
jgi:hypothetical protein